MSDRDDLVQQLRAIKSENRYDLFDTREVADSLFAAGWRQTVALPEYESAGRLRTCPAHPGHAPFLAPYGCPWCTITSLQAGRFTVTPEQVERALRKLDNFDGVLRSLADDVARARAELGNVIAGLSVTEDGQ